MSLQLELASIPKGIEGAIEFEIFCVEKIIRTHLSEILINGHAQFYTEDSQRRYDYIASISSLIIDKIPIQNPWDIFLLNFNSRCVVFEFKNFNKKIGRSEVLLTSKYLSLNAKRSVAIIFTRSGFDTSATQEALSILREYGKLIVLISIDDLVSALDDERLISDILNTQVLNTLYGLNQ